MVIWCALRSADVKAVTAIGTFWTDSARLCDDLLDLGKGWRGDRRRQQ
jgi:hypothetical protein